ncbi:MAG: molecular chaperone TorD family protein, partial [Chloroflexi bacterium]|nr:molecular chaperone TorD family protein [Chloroflexota bacterium]
MDSYVSDASLYPLLSCLWLHEPDSTALAEARRHEPFANALETDSDQTALASAYADLFLLNVYPYGTAYTDEWGELNTGEAQSAKAVYEAHGYNPPELNAVGAPDHVGLGLGFLAHLTLNPSPHEREGLKVRSDLLAWVPVCCLAVECQPFVHPFYRALVKLTRETLWADGQWPPTTRGQNIANGSLPSAMGFPL